MKRRRDPPPELLRLADAQGGVLSGEQAAIFGLSSASTDRLVAQGRWFRLDRALFSLTPDPDWRGWAWAGILLGGDGARLGGESAGFLRGLCVEAPHEITVLVPFDRPRRSRQRWHFRRERPGVRSARSPGSPSTTTVEDTVLDPCGGLSANSAVGLVTTAVQRRLTTVPRLRARLRQRGPIGRRSVFEDLLADVRDGAESLLEVRDFRDVERAHALPSGERRARAELGRLRRDVLYRVFATIVELDGLLGHEGVGRFTDMTRDNLATVDGLATLRFGHQDVLTTPCAVAFQVAEVLITRGWTGYPDRCQRCSGRPVGSV